MSLDQFDQPPKARDFVADKGRRQRRPFSKVLIENGAVPKTKVLDAMVTARDCGVTLDRVAVAENLATSKKVLGLTAKNFGIKPLDTKAFPADPAVGGLLSPEMCLTLGVVPWAYQDGLLIVAASSPFGYDACRPLLEKKGIAPAMALATEDDIEGLIIRRHGTALAERAETRVPQDLSCRDFAMTSPLSMAVASAFACLNILALFLYPQLYFASLVSIAVGALAITQIFRIIVALKSPKFQHETAPRRLGKRPVVSVLVPLFDEDAIANSLVNRLKRLDYPKACLDVLLILEKSDQKTHAMLAQSDLPGWMRIVTVPEGTVQTKPRALNYALNYARGEIIGVLDAEDAPAADQIARIVDRFARSPPEVACLQGILDYYNPTANWLSRCFTIEYATWFRLLLPGVASAGFAVPLGGTTVYFRRAALDHVGCWDAHNVTEDADLGIRLARFGYRTEMVGTVTLEEANNRPWPWIKQRSRWLKGYLQTWLVHSRNPRRLLRELGLKRFLGFHALFLCSSLQFLLMPVLWSFWLVVAGLPHPLDGFLTPDVRYGLTALFLSSEALSVTIGAFALARSPHKTLMPWVPSLLLYFPLGCIAAYKALWELVRKPFFWDKTAHGTSLPQTDTHV